MVQQKDGPVDLGQLDIFLAVCSAGTMSGAAKTLNISQSAVSQAIAKLEASLGLVLVDRARRPLALTASGLFIAQNGEPIIAQARRLQSQASEISETGNLRLRMGMIDSFAKTIGPSVIKRLYKHTSGLSVQIGMAVAQDQALLRRDVDMVVTTNPFIDNTAFDHRLLYREGFIAMAPRRRAANRQAPSIASLALAMPLIRFSRLSALSIRVERILRHHRLDLPRKLEVDHADTMTLLVAEGLGWAISTPTCLMQTGDRFLENLEVIAVSERWPRRSIFLVWRRGEYPALSDDIVEVVRGSIQNLLVQQVSPEQKLVAGMISLDD